MYTIVYQRQHLCILYSLHIFNVTRFGISFPYMRTVYLERVICLISALCHKISSSYTSANYCVAASKQHTLF